MTDRSISIEEDNEPITHSSHILAAQWDWEPPEDFEAPGFQPWSKNFDGKGLLNAQGQILTWRTNAMGEPHHDEVSSEQGFPYVAKLTIYPNGRVFIPSSDELHLFGISREDASQMLQQAAPGAGLTADPGFTASNRSCPTCGDPLTGPHGTFCPRCQWSEMDANLDSDPLSNPPDPTVDLHRGIQARVKMSDKLHDFLMNPKSRPDLQTPEGQRWLTWLKHHHHVLGEKFDPLTPWLTREWKKGRVQHPDPTGNPLYTPHYTNADGDVPLTHDVLSHWSDFHQSNHPLRRAMGDLMKHDIHSFPEVIRAWDRQMAEEAGPQALQGGQVVHTTPDNWTVRQLTKPEELTAEGDAMGHCVGGYAPSVERGDSLIYSLRDPEGQPHATTEIAPKYVEWHGQRINRANLDTSVAPEGIDREGYGESIPHSGTVTQIQGKSNQEPLDEYKAKLADWFRTFHPDERPTWEYSSGENNVPIYDADGYTHYDIDHPDLIPEVEATDGGLAKKTEPFEDAYGLIRQPINRGVDYDALLDNIKIGETNWSTTRPDSDHIKDVYRLAKERGEIPEFAEALEHYQEKQDDNFFEWQDQNYEYAPRYVDPADPHGWEDEEGESVDEGEGKPYWQPEPGDWGEKYYDPDEAEKAYEQAQDEWTDQHGGLNAVGQLYNLVNQHHGPHPETGEPGYWNEIQPQPPQQPQAFSSTIPSHRWLAAVEDSP